MVSPECMHEYNHQSEPQLSSFGLSAAAEVQQSVYRCLTDHTGQCLICAVGFTSITVNGTSMASVSLVLIACPM